ncbi:hypothetical protein [Nostoc sp. TCL240-02]|uniref:hypothetical protein n=1 Tax=Nostoc sp. TCL240-02 TaxID=2572090 RepID=UPI00157F9AE5|nr:hypothetical protein [Nostoc sp. TCL240-02]QKQ76364.1 hypothetical protein FBB35_26505 [Nostoc sp. TCL240-02]
MIGTKFIDKSEVYVVVRSFVSDTAWVCKSEATGNEKWYYTEEIEEGKITELPPHKLPKVKSKA